MQALLIETERSRLPDVWALLGEDAHSYGDNGGDSDGPSWLPQDPEEMSQDAVAAVVAAGLGRMVEVRFATDDAIARLGGLGPLTEESYEDRDTLESLLRCAADERSDGWAHFGAYGTLDSRWVFIPRD